MPLETSQSCQQRKNALQQMALIFDHRVGADAILEDAGLHTALAPLIVLELRRRLVALDLANRIKALEAAL